MQTPEPITKPNLHFRCVLITYLHAGERFLQVSSVCCERSRHKTTHTNDLFSRPLNIKSHHSGLNDQHHRNNTERGASVNFKEPAAACLD